MLMKLPVNDIHAQTMLLFKVKRLAKVRVHTYHFSSTAMKVLRGLLPTVPGGGNRLNNEIINRGLD